MRAAAALLTLADRRVNVLYQRCQRRRPKLEYYILYYYIMLLQQYCNTGPPHTHTHARAREQLPHQQTNGRRAHHHH